MSLTLLIVATAMIGLLACSASARADESAVAGEGLTLPLLERAREAGQTIPEATDPEAAEELPHRDLGREEAIELSESVFGPRAPSVSIGKGHDSRLAWIAFLESPETDGATQADPMRPCVTLRVAYPTWRDPAGYRHYEVGESTECRQVSEGTPVIQSFGVGSGRREETALVFIYSPLATKMTLYLRGKPPRTVGLRHLTAARAAELSIDPVSVWAGSVSGSFCLRRVKFYDKYGDVLNDSGRTPCRIQR